MNQLTKLEIFQQLLHKKSGLLRCIFTTVIFQLSVTSLVAAFIHKKPELLPKHLNIYWVLGLLFSCTVLVLGMIIPQNLSFYKRFGIFIIFSIVQGALLGILTKYLPSEIILSAVVSTAAIFSTLLIIGAIIVYFGIDLSWLGIFLLTALLGLVIKQIVGFFIPSSNTSRHFTTLFALVIFSLYILYDTNNILLKYQNTDIDCIRGSLDYYLDIINLFVHSIDSK